MAIVLVAKLPSSASQIIWIMTVETSAVDMGVENSIVFVAQYVALSIF